MSGFGQRMLLFAIFQIMRQVNDIRLCGVIGDVFVERNHVSFQWTCDVDFIRIFCEFVNYGVRIFEPIDLLPSEFFFMKRCLRGGDDIHKFCDFFCFIIIIICWTIILRWGGGGRDRFYSFENQCRTKSFWFLNESIFMKNDRKLGKKNFHFFRIITMIWKSRCF